MYGILFLYYLRGCLIVKKTIPILFFCLIIALTFTACAKINTNPLHLPEKPEITAVQILYGNQVIDNVQNQRHGNITRCYVCNANYKTIYKKRKHTQEIEQ